jgi:hypothetical protein
MSHDRPRTDGCTVELHDQRITDWALRLMRMVDPIGQVTQKFFRSRRHGRLPQGHAQSENISLPETYHILVQHSHGESVRSAMSSSSNTLYHQAGLRTPAQNALSDFMAGYSWLRHVWDCASTSENLVIWLQTTSRPIPPHVLQKQQQEGKRIKVLQLSFSSEFGGDSDLPGDGDNSTAVVPCGKLQTISNAICNVAAESGFASMSVLFESVTPLLLYHGSSRVLSWLSQIVPRFRCDVAKCLLVTPVSKEMLSSAEHLQWEDAADATLLLQDGSALWVYRSVRHYRDNLMRTPIPYEISCDDTEDMPVEQSLYVNLSIPHVTVNESVAEKSDELAATDTHTEGKYTMIRGAKARPRVELQLEDESRISAPGSGIMSTAPESTSNEAAGPRIFLQDDDPEFDDFDEEDPDDDLEL